MSEDVILVDMEDRPIGKAEKIEAHAQNLRHRAVSALVFDRQGHMLLQKRSETKYHSPGLWSNACCGHPRPGEAASDATVRRLQEEMGFTCRLKPIARFPYGAPVAETLFENEIVHVFVGRHDGAISPDAEEVSDFDWRPVSTLRYDIGERPHRYTMWFRLYAQATWFEPPGAI